MRQFFENEIADTIEILGSIRSDDGLLDTIENASNTVTDALKAGKKVMFAGNGGSAADSQHLAAELVGKFCFDRPSLPGIALTTDTSILTAIGNDYGYDQIFLRQINALGNAGDIFIGISTSGNSANLLEAFKVAREKGITSIGLTGQTGGAMKELCDICICVPSTVTQKIQEMHILIGHSICAFAEQQIFGDSS